MSVGLSLSRLRLLSIATILGWFVNCVDAITVIIEFLSIRRRHKVDISAHGFGDKPAISSLVCEPLDFLMLYERVRMCLVLLSATLWKVWNTDDTFQVDYLTVLSHCTIFLSVSQLHHPTSCSAISLRSNTISYHQSPYLLRSWISDIYCLLRWNFTTRFQLFALYSSSNMCTSLLPPECNWQVWHHFCFDNRHQNIGLLRVSHWERTCQHDTKLACHIMLSAAICGWAVGEMCCKSIF